MSYPKIDLSPLKDDILKALSLGANPIAAFDADGTLWDTDLGENFFNYKAEKKLLPELPKDPWAHYESLKKVNQEQAYLWLAQILSGVHEEEVRKWSEDSFKSLGKPPIFPAIEELIEFLKSQGVKVYIVTASIRWAVEPGAQYLGIPVEQVVGITTKVIDGKITPEQEGPITWREGKPEALMLKTNQNTPFLAAGNTEGDLALLKSASHVKLVNVAAPEGEKNYETERTLVDIAKENKWHIYDYLNNIKP